MKFKTTIILLIIALIGVAYIFLYEKKQYRKEVWLQRQIMALPDYKAGQISKIEIKKEKDSIVLENIDEEHWRMLEPLQIRADKAEVTDILSQFEFLRKIGTIKESEVENFNLKDYGLDQPKIIVNLWKKKGGMTLKETDVVATGTESKYTINVGDKLAAGQNTIYINVEGNKDVFVVPAKILEKINKDINEVRNKWVFEFDEDAVERLRIQSDSKEAIVCSKADQHWWMSQPVSDRGDSERIKGILNELKNIKIDKTEFVSDNKDDISRHGLDKPRLTVSIGYKDKSQSILLGHNLDNKVYAKRDDESAIFLVHDVVIRDLDLEPNDLRDKQLLRFDSIGTYGIEKIELKYPDTTLTMEKTKQYDWMIKSPTEILADRDTVRDFVEKIKDLQIQNYVDDSGENYDEYGLEKDFIEVSVFRKIGEGETVKFMIGNADANGGLCYVKRDGGNTVYSVPTENFYDVATGGFIAFRDKIVLEFPKENAQKLVIDRDGKTFVCQREADTNVEKWFLTNPVSVEADTDAVNQVVWNLSFLKVGKLVALSAEDLGKYGLDSPGIKVSVTYEGSGSTESSDEVISEEGDLTKPKEKTTKTLLVGKKLEPEKDKSNYFAKFADEDIIFQIGWPDIRDYSIELASKSLFDFDTTQVNYLKIKYPEKKLSLQKDEDEKWKMLQPEEKILKGNFADRVLTAMNVLKAESVVQYTSDNLSEFELDNPRFSVTVGFKDGENSLLVGKITGTDYFVMNKPLNLIYRVRKNKIENLVSEKGLPKIQ